MVRYRLHQTAPRLLHELSRRCFVGAGRLYRRGAGSGRGQSLIVNLIGHFPFVHQQLVAVEIVLRPDVVRLSLLQLGVGGKELLFGGRDACGSVFDVRRSGRELAHGTHRGNRHCDVQRLSCGFGTGQVGFRLRDRNLIVLRIDLHQHGALLHPLVVFHVDPYHIAGNTRADGIQVNIRLGVVGGFIAAEVAPQEQATN